MKKILFISLAIAGLVVVKRPIKKYKQTTNGKTLNMARFWIGVLERAWPYLCFVNFVKLYRNFIRIIGLASELHTTPTHQSSRKSETSASFHDCRLEHYQEKT